MCHIRIVAAAVANKVLDQRFSSRSWRPGICGFFTRGGAIVPGMTPNGVRSFPHSR